MKNTGFYDMDGREYQIGDIVLNTFFGDLWLVRPYIKTEYYNGDCPYCLDLLGDYYNMDLDEPSKFRILSRIGDSNYEELLNKYSNKENKRIYKESIKRGNN